MIFRDIISVIIVLNATALSEGVALENVPDVSKGAKNVGPSLS